MIDLGERVLAVVCDYGQREPDAPEVALNTATVWTVRDGLIVRADLYAGGTRRSNGIHQGGRVARHAEAGYCADVLGEPGPRAVDLRCHWSR